METRVEERGKCLESQQLPLIGVATAFPSLPVNTVKIQRSREGSKLKECGPRPGANGFLASTSPHCPAACTEPPSA